MDQRPILSILATTASFWWPAAAHAQTREVHFDFISTEAMQHRPGALHPQPKPWSVVCERAPWTSTGSTC